MNDQGAPVLYAIVTGAPPARDIDKLIDLAQADGWDVCVIASPEGSRFIDADALETKTGHPVRSRYKDPGTPDLFPPADGMIVAPITSNSLAKWAAGISDTLPLGLLVEAVGKRMPVVAVPSTNSALRSFPAIGNAIANLSEWGVTMVAGEPHSPGAGEGILNGFPWAQAWAALLEHPWLAVDSEHDTRI
ncbi:flavoprotein [Nocardia sp. CDC153]|uniref:flavoprotein n=1 Tax=Nocardia sp. CDC153 TaxID=3112167 RepID=UPI002DB8175B|nr:flavoprotein [Nocardia sp. CDC153]MEC3958883.1 flavoprotein [Nocardia sp. CDC153]